MKVIGSTNTTRISPLIVALGGVVGSFLSFMVMSGDAQGRVNLLYLLLVFLVIPVAGAAISLFSLFGKTGINFAQLLASVPMWSKPQRDFMFALRQKKLDTLWFFMQSQAAALSYSCVALVVFFLLLLATDINFVWRSTLLNAEDLLPILQVVSSPWFFWDTAQPTLELLQATQDSRLTSQYSDTASFGQWWAFVLATQIVYSLALRGIMLAAGIVWLRNSKLERSSRKTPPVTSPTSLPQEPKHELAAFVDSLPVQFALVNWAGIDAKILAQVNLQSNQELKAGPLASEQQNQNAANNKDNLVLCVKAWEPPLGELADFLQRTKGTIVPINYTNEAVAEINTTHLEEWQRFVAKFATWNIYNPIKRERHG